MWQSKVEYFQQLRSDNAPVIINLRSTDRVCKGYIGAVNVDGVFVATKMGDGQEPGIMDLIFIPYSAISFVECGL